MDLKKLIVSFWDSLPEGVIPLMAESKMYSVEYKYAGTCDNLFYDSWAKGIIISDYKTNKKFI